MKGLCDSHVHSHISHDGAGRVTDLAEAAIRRRMAAFAVTDHCDIEYYTERRQAELIAASAAETEQAAKEYDGRIGILTGVEIGEGIWNAAYTRDILSRHDYDVVLASVHAVRYKDMTAPFSGIDFRDVPQGVLDEYMARYFDDVLETAETVPCDVMPHLGNPLKYITGVYGRAVDLRRFEDRITGILERIIEKEIALEINTSCVSAPYGDFMPETWIAARYKALGGRLVTIASDAHRAEHIGRDLDAAVDLLKTLGFSQYYYYKKRKPVARPL